MLAALKVSQEFTSPVRRPVRNHRTRCAREPCVKLRVSATTRNWSTVLALGMLHDWQARVMGPAGPETPA